MYPEFIIIYVLLAIILILLVALFIVTLKNKKSSGKSKDYTPGFTAPASPVQSSIPDAPASAPVNSNVGVVFCTKCAHQYSAAEKFCPYCGNPRS